MVDAMRVFMDGKRWVLVLWVNAGLLVLVLLGMVARGGSLPGSPAWGQQMRTPISDTGAGVTVMPGQLSPNTWGCYVMDTQNQTLSVYQFSPGDHNLKLAAARDIQYDRKLKFFNTSPPPAEIKSLVERGEQPVRAAPTTNRSPEVDGDR